MIKDSEYLCKLEKLRGIYHHNHKRGLLITKQNNLSWLLQGRTHVNLASVDGIGELLLTETGIYLIANNIEAQRLMKEEFNLEAPQVKEEFSGTTLTVKEYNWYDSAKHDQIIEELVGKDYLTDQDCEQELHFIRLIMTPAQQESYRTLGKDAAQIMEKTCQAVTPGMTEYQMAAMMGQKCIARGIDPVVLLVAGDERVSLYRHPLPTAKPVYNYCMLVLGGRRYGQIVNITRFVAFSEPTTEIKRRRDAVLRIDTCLLTETRPGVSTGKVFQLLLDAYKREGFSEEWKLHHQGGLTGYNSREFKITPTIDIAVQVGQVYAWNPSITGFKSEDTFIVDETENLILTPTPEIPHQTVEYKGKIFERPGIFIRKL